MRPFLGAPLWFKFRCSLVGLFSAFATTPLRRCSFNSSNGCCKWSHWDQTATMVWRLRKPRSAASSSGRSASQERNARSIREIITSSGAAEQDGRFQW